MIATLRSDHLPLAFRYLLNVTILLVLSVDAWSHCLYATDPLVEQLSYTHSVPSAAQ